MKLNNLICQGYLLFFRKGGGGFQQSVFFLIQSFKVQFYIIVFNVNFRFHLIFCENKTWYPQIILEMYVSAL